MADSSFQGKDVHVEKIRLTGGSKEMMAGVGLPKLDQIVEAKIEGRVIGYDYKVNEKTGELEATAIVRVLEVEDLKTMSIPSMTMVVGGQP